MARSHYELEASNAASSQLESTNARPSRPSLIPKKPEFNLEYLRFAY